MFSIGGLRVTVYTRAIDASSSCDSAPARPGRTVLKRRSIALAMLALASCGRVAFERDRFDAALGADGAARRDASIDASDASDASDAGIDASSGRLMRYAETLTQAQAVAACTSRGAVLATPTSPREEAECVRDLPLGLQYVWIGLDDQEREGTFRSSEGSTYVHWNVGEPNSPDGVGEVEDCVAIELFDGVIRGWNDTECDDPVRVESYCCRSPR